MNGALSSMLGLLVGRRRRPSSTAPCTPSASCSGLAMAPCSSVVVLGLVEVPGEQRQDLGVLEVEVLSRAAPRGPTSRCAAEPIAVDQSWSTSVIDGQRVLRAVDERRELVVLVVEPGEVALERGEPLEQRREEDGVLDGVVGVQLAGEPGVPTAEGLAPLGPVGLG